MDTRDFVKEVESHLGNAGQHFENPEHALLWALRHEKDMPKAFATRVQEELHELNPHVPLALREKQAATLEAHMMDLSYTGHLDSEGNIFRSTNTDDWLDPTQWQRQLRKEAQDAELEQFVADFKAYPEQAGVAKAMLKQLQKLRIKGSDIPERYIDFSEKIRQSIKPRPARRIQK